MMASTETGSVRRAPWLGGLLTLTACLAVLSILSLTRSLVTMTYLSIRFADEVDPFSRAVSYYVFVDDGRQTFAASVLVIAFATITMLIGIVRAGVRLGARATIFFGMWCTSLALCVVFPTDNGKVVVSTSGMVHQVAGATLYVSLPLAGLSLAKRLTCDEHWARTARVVRWLAMAAMGLAAAYLAARLPDIVPGLTLPGVLDGRGLSGLVQRVLFGLEMFMLLTLAVHLLRVSVTRHRRRRLATAEAPG